MSVYDYPGLWQTGAGLYGAYPADGWQAGAGLYGAYSGSGLWQTGLGPYGLFSGNGTRQAGVSGLSSGAGTAPYTSFVKALRKAAENTQAFPAGRDVVMGHPPARPTNYHVDESKATEDMTLDEYKRYICNRISELPVSDSMRANCRGLLVIKEEAFVNMQKDPEYEKSVLNMLRTGFQTQFPFYSPNFGIQVIGGSEKECYGEGVPVSSGSTRFFGKEKSWWEKRHERMEHYIQGNGIESIAGHSEKNESVSLSERLASNRASRLQARLLGRQQDASQDIPQSIPVMETWATGIF